MNNVARYAGQAVFYVLVMALVGYFASQPSYQRFPDDKAQIKIAFSHGAQRKEACRRLTSAEIAKLPPNERRVLDCERERLSIHVQLELDDRILIDRNLQPTGLWNDGPARLYKSFQVTPGRHALTLRLTDSARTEGFDFETSKQLDLKPRQNLAIDFKADTGGFQIR